MADPQGFSYEVRGSEVAVFHHSRRATTLRGAAAGRFLRAVKEDDPQQVMARVTGNYKRGNERMGRDHPRNR
jgi:hypothetical protein